MQTIKSFIGMDVHKATISISVAEDGRSGPVRFLGVIPNAAEDIAKLAKRLAKDGELDFCYEAGGCGYGYLRCDFVDGLANKKESFPILFNPNRPRAAKRLDLLKHLAQWLEIVSEKSFTFRGRETSSLAELDLNLRFQLRSEISLLTQAPPVVSRSCLR